MSGVPNPAAWIDGHDPRPFKPCPTCHDIGMIERHSDGAEDTCPTCEGGIFRERWPWRAYIEALRWRRWYVDLHGIPTIRRGTDP